jgi:serine/threonine protein kinase
LGLVITALDRAPELPKYELLERIGVGGMATVYRARDRRLGREVAVKLIHAHLRENKEVAARFVSEARAVARIRHPNVVEVFDVSDETEEERYLVVELVRGTTLRALLSRHTRLTPELTAAIGLEVAAGLAVAHREEIVHRDVKPENVLVDLSGATSAPSGERSSSRAMIKLTDFGIAKLLDAQGVTSTGQVLGSPAHMAPEQIEGGDVGPRADVFALGVMLYESMVGRLPFDGKNPAQVLRRVLDGSYPPADREQPTVGARWAAVLAKALAREAVDRYESIDAFAAALKAELERVGIADPGREIEHFLSDQDAYAAAVEPGIVEALISSGERARAAGDFGLAAAQFNRALAYRPGEPDLVRRVTNLARREQFAFGAKAAGAVGVCLGVMVLAVGHFRHAHVAPLLPKPAPPQKSPGIQPPIGPRSAIGPAAVTSAQNPTTNPPRRKYVAARESAHPAPPSPPSTRPVVVDVMGPKGGYLMIDGEKQESWFGIEHAVTVGSHTFEFIPNNSDCCIPSPQVIRVIEEGEGAVHVTLIASFREARLRVDRGQGRLRCPSLFSAELSVPGELPVTMSAPTATGPCTLTPSDQAQGAPLTKEVTLAAGQTTEVSWP